MPIKKTLNRLLANSKPMVAVGVLSFLLANLSAVFAGVIPASRIFPEAWQSAGNPGNPPPQTRAVDVRDFNAAGDGLSDDHPALLAALASLGGDSGIVYFPPGEYLLQSAVNIPSGVVLRGHSAAQTTLRFDFVEPAINFTGGPTGSSISFATAAPLRADSITLANTTGLAPGDYALLTQDDDPAWNITDSWAAGSAGQVIQITAIDGNQITLKRPLRHDFPLARNPRLQRIEPNFQSGIENMKLVRELAGDNSTRNNKATVRLSYAVGGWVRGVHSRMAFGSHVEINYSHGIEVTGCDFDDAPEHDGGGSGYGVKLQFRSSDCLVQDNIFRRLRHSMLLQAGPNGNVFGYNYSREGKSDAHPGYASDIALHGNYPFANLFEGNIVGHIWVDNSHDGANGPHNTFFRNRAETAGLNIDDSRAHRQNVVGNELFRGNWIDRFWAGDGYRLDGNEHFTYGNYSVADGLQPGGTDDLADFSYYLDDDPSVAPVMPDWWTIPAALPVIGPPNSFSPDKTIPARTRWTSGATLTVPAAVPEIGLDGSAVSLVEGSGKSGSFTVVNNGTAPLNRQIGPVTYRTGPHDWITGTSPASGLLEPGQSAQVTLTADRSLLGPDTANATVSLLSNGDAASLPVDASEIRFQIQTQAGPGGSILPNNPEVAAGEDILFSIQPQPYYDVSGLRVDGSPVTPATEYLWASIRAPGSLSADFAPRMVATAPVAVPEAWLAEHGNTTSLDSAVMEDPDGDGFAVWEEYVLDTDPADAASAFESRLQIFDDLNTLVIRFGPSSAARIYTLQSSADLSSDGWQAVPGHGPRAGAGGPDSMSLPQATDTSRFYRIEVRLFE